MGWFTPELTTAEVRLMGDSAWEIVTFMLNALLFTLIGLQLPGILDELDAYSTTDLLWWGVAVWLTVVLVRVLWAYPAAWLPRRLFRRIRERDPMPPNAWLALISWAGMRGGVSLAAALAIPLTTDAGEPFPNRDLILFLTFAVIFGTLVVQGLTLPAVIRLLRLEDESEAAARELAQARIQAAEAALARLEELTGEDWVREDTATGSAAPTTSGRAASPPGSMERTTARSSRARSIFSGCAASCSPPSAPRCTSCAARARSPTRWRGASNETSISRTPA